MPKYSFEFDDDADAAMRDLRPFFESQDPADTIRRALALSVVAAKYSFVSDSGRRVVRIEKPTGGAVDVVLDDHPRNVHQ